MPYIAPGITVLQRTQTLYHLPQQQAATQQQAPRAPGRRDQVAITPAQQANKMIAALKEQKQNIIKAKGELAKHARDNGKSYDDIKPQMESYNELIKSLDEQMEDTVQRLAQLEAAKLAELKEKQAEKRQKTEQTEPQTEEELQAKQMGELTELSVGMTDLRDKAAVQNRLERQEVILRSEIEFDESLGGGLPAAEKRATLRKIRQLRRDYQNDIATDLRRAHSDLAELRDPEEKKDPGKELPTEAELAEQEQAEATEIQPKP